MFFVNSFSMKHIHYGMMFRTPGSTCDMTTLLCLIIFVYPSLCIALETLHVSPELSHHIRMMGVSSLARIMSCCMRENVNLMLFTIWCKAIQFKLESQGPRVSGLEFHNSTGLCADFLTTLSIIQSSLSNDTTRLNKALLKGLIVFLH